MGYSSDNELYLNFALQVLNMGFELVYFVIHAINGHLKVIQGQLPSCKLILKRKNKQKKYDHFSQMVKHEVSQERALYSCKLSDSLYLMIWLQGQTKTTMDNFESKSCKDVVNLM